MHFKTGYYWSAGPICPVNQDSLSIQHVSFKDGEALLAVVCDGIGSIEGSQNAGALVVKQLTGWFYQEGKSLIRDLAQGPVILLSLQRCMHGIAASFSEIEKKTGHATGTTCSALLMLGSTYYKIHIGDSRIYKISRNNPIKRLLKKKPNMELLTMDDIDPKGRLKKALGFNMKDRPSITMDKIKRGDVFIICSDGFYYKNEEDMELSLGVLCEKNAGNYISGSMLDRKLEQLGERAIKKGSEDNLTGIVIACV